MGLNVGPFGIGEVGLVCSSHTRYFTELLPQNPFSDSFFTEFSEVGRREEEPKANRRPFFMPRPQPSSTVLVVPVVLVDDGMTLTA